MASGDHSDAAVAQLVEDVERADSALGLLQATQALAAAAHPAAAACLVNRSGGQLPAMDFPFHGLVELNPETFDPEALPPDLAAIPAIKPGSK